MPAPARTTPSPSQGLIAPSDLSPDAPQPSDAADVAALDDTTLEDSLFAAPAHAPSDTHAPATSVGPQDFSLDIAAIFDNAGIDSFDLNWGTLPADDVITQGADFAAGTPDSGLELPDVEGGLPSGTTEDDLLQIMEQWLDVPAQLDSVGYDDLVVLQ